MGELRGAGLTDADRSDCDCEKVCTQVAVLIPPYWVIARHETFVLVWARSGAAPPAQRSGQSEQVP